jgi:hypothetical protein
MIQSEFQWNKVWDRDTWDIWRALNDQFTTICDKHKLNSSAVADDGIGKRTRAQFKNGKSAYFRWQPEQNIMSLTAPDSTAATYPHMLLLCKAFDKMCTENGG